MRKYLLVTLILLLVPALLISMTLEEKKAKAKKLVEDGVKFFEKNGIEASIKEFEKEGSKFKEGEFYLFGMDLNGKTIFHGQKPALKGNSMLEVTDAKGIHFGAQFVLTAQKGENEGWVDYQWVNKEEKIADKTSFIKRVPDTNYLIGCGFYK